ncbi:MAG: rhomboid family intramembrane serine protease [Evtepia gabavorous]
MRAMQQWLDRFCYKHPRLSIPGLMRYIVIGNVLVFLLDLFSTGGYPIATSLLSFSSDAILQGQIWRIITFVFVPATSRNIFLFAITLYFYYFIGNALEREWGSNKFTIFYFFGILLNILVGFLVGTASMYYVNMSMFFAFATLYPNLQFLLFFIIPVKAKWLAWIDAAYFALAVLQYLLTGHFPVRADSHCGCAQLPSVLRRGHRQPVLLLEGRAKNRQGRTSTGRPQPSRQRPQGGQLPRRQNQDQNPIPAQVRRVRQDRPDRPANGVPLLLPVQRLLLLLRRPHQQPYSHPMRARTGSSPGGDIL